MTLIKASFPAWPSMTDFFDDNFMTARYGNGGLSPATNVIDNVDNYEIEVAAPGFKKEDFYAKIENGVLIINGDTQKEEKEMDKNYARKEFSSESFSKRFTLPDDVVDEEVMAKYEDGILRITIYKTEKELSIKKEIAID